MSSRIDPGQKETSFSGKIYSQKDRDGNRQLVLDKSSWLAVMNSAGVQGAADVTALKAALIAAITALA